MRHAGKLLLGALLFCAPSLVFAGTLTIGALSPAATVGVGTRVTFSTITSGIVGPTYTVSDSFPGGVTNSHIDSAGTFVWIPNKDDIGSHTLTVTATDAYGSTTVATQTIIVVAPSVSISSPVPGRTLLYGTQVNFTFSSQGFVGPVYNVVDSFVGSSISSWHITDTTFRWTPLRQDVGVHQLTVSAADMLGHFASTTALITVEGPASVSIVALTPGSVVGAGSAVHFVATTTGFVSPTLTVKDLFYADTATSTFVLDSAGRVSWTPVYNEIGVHTFLVTAKDGAGHEASARVSVTVVHPVYVPASAASAPAAPAASTPATSKSAAYVFKNLLKVGSSGAEVTALQQTLAARGYYKGPVTGYFGPLTKAGVQAFQKAQRLESPGHVGPGTRAALNK